MLPKKKNTTKKELPLQSQLVGTRLRDPEQPTSPFSMGLSELKGKLGDTWLLGRNAGKQNPEALSPSPSGASQLLGLGVPLPNS